MADWLRRVLEAAGIEVFRDVDDTLPREERWRRLTADQKPWIGTARERL
jgi:hypothetical protein